MGPASVAGGDEDEIDADLDHSTGKSVGSCSVGAGSFSKKELKELVKPKEHDFLLYSPGAIVNEALRAVACSSVGRQVSVHIFIHFHAAYCRL